MSKLIAIDGSRAFSEAKTGTENYSYQLIKGISKVDKINKYTIYIRPGVRLNEAEWPNNFSFKTINYRRLWTQIGLGIQTFIDPIDLLFVPAHTIPLLIKPGLKTVMTVHDLGSEYLPQAHQIKQALYLKFITNIQLRSVSQLIAVSEATASDLVQKAGIKRSKIKVIYEGVDRTVFKVEKKDIIRSKLRSFDIDYKKYFLFVGTVQPRKNLIRLIDGFKLFLDQSATLNQDFKLVIAGQDGWDYQKIHNRPAELGIAEKVTFLGRVTDNELVDLYNGAQAFVFPSLFEGFGLPLLEAMACGCPVLSSNSSSLPEVVAKAGLLFDPEKLSEIAKAMSEISSNQPLRATLIDKGSLNLKRFDWLEASKMTVDLFNGMLKN